MQTKRTGSLLAGITVIVLVSSAFVFLSDTTSAEENDYPTDTHRKYTVTFTIPDVVNCSYYVIDFGDGNVIDSRDGPAEGVSETAWPEGTTYTVVHTYAPVPAAYTMEFAAYNDGGESAVNGLNVELLGYPEISFESRGGSAVDTLQVINGADHGGLPGNSYYTAAERPTDPVRPGFTFTGWYTDAEMSQMYDWNSIVREDAVLYAGWEASSDAFIARYYVDRVLYSTQTYAAGETVVPPEAPSKDGFEFKGWKHYSEGMVANGDMGFCAMYEPTSPVTYSVSYVLDGRSYSTFVAAGSSAEIEAPVKEGFTFEGWYTDPGFKQEFDGESVTGDVVLYPKFTENASSSGGGFPLVPLAIAAAGMLAVFIGMRTHPAVSAAGAAAVAAGAAMGFGII